MSAISGMTGFGRADGALVVEGGGDWTWSVEARSVNGRNLEIRFRGPPGFDGLERHAKTAAQAKLSRGQVTLGIQAKRDLGVASLKVNQDILARYLTLANQLFGGQGSGRLWMRIREQGGLSYDVRSGVSWNSNEANSRWFASAIFAPQNQAKVEAAFREELDRSLKDGFTQKELDEARNGLLSERRLTRAQDGAVAGGLAENLRLGRTFARSQQVDDAIAALTLEQVNAAWRRTIDPAKVVFAWGGDFKP